MRHPETEWHFRHALFSIQGADGYVEALLEAARDQAKGRDDPHKRTRVQWSSDSRRETDRSRHAH